VDVGGDGIGPLAGIGSVVVAGAGGVEPARVGVTDVVGTALVVEAGSAGTEAGARGCAPLRGSISRTVAGALGPGLPWIGSAVDLPSTRSPSVITPIASAKATTAVNTTRRHFGGATRILSWVRRRTCS
jgi:hypothetical protein